MADETNASHDHSSAPRRDRARLRKEGSLEYRLAHPESVPVPVVVPRRDDAGPAHSHRQWPPVAGHDPAVDGGPQASGQVPTATAEAPQFHSLPPALGEPGSPASSRVQTSEPAPDTDSGLPTAAAPVQQRELTRKQLRELRTRSRGGADDAPAASDDAGPVIVPAAGTTHDVPVAWTSDGVHAVAEPGAVFGQNGWPGSGLGPAVGIDAGGENQPGEDSDSAADGAVASPGSDETVPGAVGWADTQSAEITSVPGAGPGLRPGVAPAMPATNEQAGPDEGSPHLPAPHPGPAGIDAIGSRPMTRRERRKLLAEQGLLPPPVDDVVIEPPAATGAIRGIDETGRLTGVIPVAPVVPPQIIDSPDLDDAEIIAVFPQAQQQASSHSGALADGPVDQDEQPEPVVAWGGAGAMPAGLPDDFDEDSVLVDAPSPGGPIPTTGWVTPRPSGAVHPEQHGLPGDGGIEPADAADETPAASQAQAENVAADAPWFLPGNAPASDAAAVPARAATPGRGVDAQDGHAVDGSGEAETPGAVGSEPVRRPVAARVADFEPHPWTGALKEVPVWEPPEETDPDPVTGAIPRWQPVVTGAIPIVPAPAGGFGSLRSPTEPVRFDAPDFAGTAPASQLPARHDPDFDDVIGGRAGGSYPDGADRDDPDWVDEDEPRDLRLLHYLVLVVLAIVLGLVVWRFGFDSSATDPEPTAPASSVEDDSGIVPGSDSSG